MRFQTLRRYSPCPEKHLSEHTKHWRAADTATTGLSYCIIDLSHTERKLCHIQNMHDISIIISVAPLNSSYRPRGGECGDVVI